MNTTVNEGILQLFIEMNLVLPKLKTTIGQFEKLVYDMKLNQQGEVYATDIENYYQTSVQLRDAKEEATKIEQRYQEAEALIREFMAEHRIHNIVAQSQQGDTFSIVLQQGSNELMLMAVSAAN